MLGSCAVGPNYRTPNLPTPGQYVASSTAPAQTRAAASAPVELATWWRALNDPELDSLVERALTRES